MDVTVTGAFKYHRLYRDADTEATIYEDSLFYGESIEDNMPDLDRTGCRYEIVNELVTMPANDTIISVKYYKTETDFTYNGLTYHIYTEGDNPHAELIPSTPGYAAENIIVPDSIPYFDDKYAVTVIRTDAFKNCFRLKTISLPAAVKTIGTEAFRGCKKLTEIKIPASVTAIDERAFTGCEKLEKIYIANQTTLPAANVNTFDDKTYDVATLYVSASLQAHMTSPWDNFNVVAAADDAANGGYTGCFRNIRLSKVNGEGNSYDEMTFPVSIVTLFFAYVDVNGDGSIGIAGIVAITNIMAGVTE